MNSNYYTYEQTLQKVEKFMRASGIRSFCKDVCKGACCNGCYESEEACHKNEKRRLSCSAFICLELRDLAFSPREKQIIKKVEDHCADVVEQKLGINPYFHVNTKKVQDKCKFRSSIIDRLKEIDISKAKDKVVFVKQLINRMAIHARWRKRRNET